MKKSIQLLKEIELLRSQLHKVIELVDGNLISEDVIQISQKLDQLLVEYLKTIKEEKEKPF
ncbi:MAG: Spo0E like sporulation regulatory protein [Clostridia bacterium]|jgi:hypothetical protein|nr:Spo0E like sporulation regulatory protein [Clostridia bacterium]MDN5322791.1 Spo0E like sporulation regulatory protein [Clostridia bacterium]